jgi:UDP-4-amino-4,6-dideoxy-N-acetyl-beta-L-altrosamine transaminase
MISYSKQFIDKEDIKSVKNVLKSDFLTTGPKIKEFEEALCNYTKAKYVTVVSSATAALHISSLILLEKNDLVLTTPNSFVATANSILYAGANPVFVDIDEYGNIDLDKVIGILKKFSNRIKALYLVHFSGKSVDMDKLAYIKKNFDIFILEDASHALGAKWGDFNIGNPKYSDCVIFSFHPVKSITSAEGGAILTNNQEIDKYAKILRHHGIVKDNFVNKVLAYDKKGNLNPWYYEMQYLGFNYRLSDVHAALGISQLKKLNKFLKKRRKIAKRYDKYFKDTLVKPLYPFDKNSAYHLYVVRVDFSKLKITKAELFYKMKEFGINLQLHYIPINWQPFYRNLGFGNEDIKNMQKYYNEAFSLPIYPSLDKDTQKYIVKKLIKVLK